MGQQKYWCTEREMLVSCVEQQKKSQHKERWLMPKTPTPLDWNLQILNSSYDEHRIHFNRRTNPKSDFGMKLRPDIFIFWGWYYIIFIAFCMRSWCYHFYLGYRLELCLKGERKSEAFTRDGVHAAKMIKNTKKKNWILARAYIPTAFDPDEHS